VELIRAGNPSLSVHEFDARFNRARPRVRAVARSILGDQHADDIVHHTYLAARSRLDQVRDTAALDRCLARIAENLCYQALRRSRRPRSMPCTSGCSISRRPTASPRRARSSPSTVTCRHTATAMPTQPEVTEDLGNGDYLVEGTSFQMGRYWIIDFTVTFDGQTDLVRFGLDL
jgi:DNA-directed RNA polymerase specialized sigma24 family protein